MFKAKCIKAIPLEYITAGAEYTFTRDDDTVHYTRTDGSGASSYMNVYFWDVAVDDGSIVVL